MHASHSKFHFAKKMGPLLLPIFLIALVLLLSTTAIQQYAAQPITRSSIPSFTLLPHTSVHHPIHIRAFKHLQTFSTAAVALTKGGYTPAQIKGAYNIPVTGGNGTIAIVDAYFTPNLQQDLAQFDTAYNIPSCTTTNGCLTIHFQNNTQPSRPPAGTNWDVETTIDVEWAHAIAPTAKILLYEAASDQPTDLIPGVNYVRQQPGVKSVSMSWIAPEFATEGNFENTFSQSGVSFFSASGDKGSGDGWPAVSANVISIGGTTLALNTDNSVKSETAWSGSGGGISHFLPEPAYQTTFGISHANNKRATPDISMNADPTNSPYFVIFGGNVGLVGGTSVGTPIWAAMNTLSANQITNTLLYQNAKTAYATYFRDITQGTNGTCGTYCITTTGYDFVTGLGSPISLPQNLPVTISIAPSITPPLTPTNTTTPSQTSGVSFSLSVLLHGIGIGGDNANPNSGGNTNPLHPTKTVTVTLLQSDATPITTKQGTINFTSQSGNFTGTVAMGTISSGNYLAQVKVDGFLPRQIPGIVQIAANQTTVSLQQVSLVNGDINNDNQLDILDFNMLTSCFGSKQTTSSCTNPPTTTSPGTDINDDGKVDGIDYNLFLRELSVQRGG